MVVIDQHALHERILFEELKARVERGGVESQRLLVPEPVELGDEEAAEVLDRRDVLARLGLEVEPFGGGTVLVSQRPRDARADRARAACCATWPSSWPAGRSPPRPTPCSTTCSA